MPHTCNDTLHGILKVKRVDRSVAFPCCVQCSLVTDVGDISTCQNNRGAQGVSSAPLGLERREERRGTQAGEGWSRGTVQAERRGEGWALVLMLS